MPTITLLGQKIPYLVIRTKRNRYVRLTVTMGKGLRVSTPPRFPMHELPAIIHSRKDWIVEKLVEFARLQKKIPRQRFRNGSTIMFLGRAYRLTLVPTPFTRPHVRLNGSDIEISIPQALHNEHREEYIKNVITAWYRLQASKIVRPRVATWATLMKLKPGKVTIKKAKTRWASCSEQGNLNFNLRLVMVPPSVMDYVIIHELAHLRELNHSERYWKIVDRYCPRRKRIQEWLKEHAYYLEQ